MMHLATTLEPAPKTRQSHVHVILQAFLAHQQCKNKHSNSLQVSYFSSKSPGTPPPPLLCLLEQLCLGVGFSLLQHCQQLSQFQHSQIQSESKGIEYLDVPLLILTYFVPKIPAKTRDDLPPAKMN